MSAIDFLLQSQNADGGWGYRMGGMSYVEPTAAVMISLRDVDLFMQGDARTRASKFLLRSQNPDYAWGIAPMDSESGWMTAWAVRAPYSKSVTMDDIAGGLNWLKAAEGLRVTDTTERAKIKQMFRIDSALRGWPWQKGDASWVHPTALAILALTERKWGNARIQEGVQYLFDRAVPSGGWNVGNPWMLDKQIPATIQDTAVALLALRAVDQPANEPRIASAIQFLRDAVARAQTPAELAWGVYALKKWDVDTRDALARLNALQKANGSWNDNPFITAIAVMASQVP